MQNLNINVRGASASSEMVFLYFRNDESGDLIRSIPAKKSPVPDVDEVVQFGEMTLTGSENEVAEIKDPQLEEDAYVVQERVFAYYRTDVEAEDLGMEDEAMVTSVDLYVKHVDDIEDQEGSEEN